MMLLEPYRQKMALWIPICNIVIILLQFYRDLAHAQCMLRTCHHCEVVSSCREIENYEQSVTDCIELIDNMTILAVEYTPSNQRCVTASCSDFSFSSQDIRVYNYTCDSDDTMTSSVSTVMSTLEMTSHFNFTTITSSTEVVTSATGDVSLNIAYAQKLGSATSESNYDTATSSISYALDNGTVSTTTEGVVSDVIEVTSSVTATNNELSAEILKSKITPLYIWPCLCRLEYSDLNEAEIVQRLIGDTSVDKSMTAAAINKLVSKPDFRQSANVIGAAFVVILVTCFCLLIAFDVTKCISKWKRNTLSNC